MHDQELESVDTAKYLGVTVSGDLSWNTHISNITASANKTQSVLIGFVKKISKLKTEILEHWHIIL